MWLDSDGDVNIKAVNTICPGIFEECFRSFMIQRLCFMFISKDVQVKSVNK